MAKAYDPIAPVAEEISEEACLLCFDEFQVNVSLSNCVVASFVIAEICFSYLLNPCSDNKTGTENNRY